MARVKPMQQAVIISAVAFLTIFSFSIRASAGESLAKVIHVTAEQRIALILKGLEKAINNPSSYNLQILLPYMDMNQKSTIIEKLRYFCDSKEDYDNGFNFAVKQQIQIKLHNISTYNDDFNVSTRVIIRLNQLTHQEIIPISFAKSGDNLESVSLLISIDAINRFIDDSRESALGKIAPLDANEKKVTRDFQDYKSDNLLISQALYPAESVERFIVPESKRLFNDNVIFGHPYEILPVGYMDTSGFWDIFHEFLIIADPAWNRFIATDVYNDWITAIGTYGTGAYNFKQPVGLAYICPDGYIVADKYNFRASVYKMTDHNNGEYEYVTSLQNNYGAIFDVASAKYYYTGVRQVAVLDRENCRVDIFDVTGDYSFSFYKSLFSPGSEIGHLSNPTSICFGKTWIGQDHTPHIYVADAGNRRIVRGDINSDEVIVSNYQFPENTYLSSIDMGHFGEVYAVDKYNCMIYEFNYDLDSLIAFYGTKGDGDKELTYPLTFRTTEIYDFAFTNPTMLPCADAFITEYFGESTGIRRYHLSNEVLWHELTYNLVHSGGFNLIELDWHQSGTAVTTEKIHIRGGGKDTTIHNSTYEYSLPGGNDLWLIPEQAPRLNGYYVFEVTLNSVFGTNSTTIKDSVYIAYPEEPTWVNADSCNRDSGMQINIHWDNSVGGCNYFDVYQNSAYLGSVPKSQNSWTARDLVYGQTYSYKIQSRWNNEFFSDFSEPDSTFPSGFIPDAPSNANVGRDNHTCAWVISWTDNSINEEEFYIHVHYYDPNAFPPYRNDYIYPDSNTTSATYYNSVTNVYLNFDIYARDWQNCCFDYDCWFYSHPPATVTAHAGICEPLSCPFLHVWNGYEFGVENNILSVSNSTEMLDSDFVEFHYVDIEPVQKEGNFEFLITESGQNVTTLDYLSLLMLKVNGTGELVMDRSARFHTILEKVRPIRAVDHKGHDVTSLIADKDGNSCYWAEPGYLIVEFQNLPSTYKSASVPEDGGTVQDPPIKGQDSPMEKINSGNNWRAFANRLAVYVDINGEWRLIETTYGSAFNRRQTYVPLQEYIQNDSTLRVKYQWNVAYRTDEIAYAHTRTNVQSLLISSLQKATHSRRGDVSSAIKFSDNNRTDLLPGDTIALSFKAPEMADSTGLKYVLLAEGSYTCCHDSKALEHNIAADTVMLPTSFSFEQNYPNPFNPATTFRFSLPTASRVNLVVYNILGQKVATPIDQEYEAGVYSIRWNNSNLGSGIYFAKFKAGSFSSTRKVVVLK